MAIWGKEKSKTNEKLDEHMNGQNYFLPSCAKAKNALQINKFYPIFI